MCDIYEPRFQQVNRMVGSEVPHTNDYRELLARKDLDAIYVATPLAHHAEHVLAALKTGRPVYGEKAMGFTPERMPGISTRRRRRQARSSRLATNIATRRGCGRRSMR